MPFCFPAKMSSNIARVQWLGQAGAVDFKFVNASSSEELVPSQPSHFRLIGVHAPHAIADFMPWLADIQSLVKRRPCGAGFAIIGDFNTDILPILSLGPYREHRLLRDSKHAEKREVLEDFCIAIAASRPSFQRRGPLREGGRRTDLQLG
jgi:hypothetical protein